MAVLWRNLAFDKVVFVEEWPIAFDQCGSKTALTVDPPISEPSVKEVSRPEIIVGSVIIRVEEGASAARIAAIARACAVPA